MAKRDLPIYEQVNDQILLVGVDHTYRSRRQRRSKKQRRKESIFLERLGRADRLAFESTPDLWRKYSSDRSLMGGTSYETLARGEFSHLPFHHLDVGADYVSSATANGVSPQEFVWNRFVHSSYKHIKIEDSVAAEDLATNFRAYLKFELGNRGIDGHIQIPELDVKRVIDSSGPWLEVCSKREVLHTSRAIAKIFSKYMACLRDIHIYAPRLRQIASDHSGVTAAVLGASHVPRLTTLLQRGDFQVPSWRRYLAREEPSLVRSNRIQSLMFNQLWEDAVVGAIRMNEPVGGPLQLDTLLGGTGVMGTFLGPSGNN